MLFDSWYASLPNLPAVRDLGGPWLTQLRGNRRVNPHGTGNAPLGDIAIPDVGRTVHLRGDGFIKVLRTVSQDGDVERWATSDLALRPEGRDELARQAWGVEVYHRGLKQCCGVERSPARKAAAQRQHILLSLRAFLRLEAHRLRTGVSWYEAKARIVRDALRTYLAYPWYLLAPTA